MPIVPFLAMSPAEMHNCTVFPEKTAWLGCRFSSWNPGLCNLPDSLPPDSVLILTDQNFFDEHDPKRILEQLERCIEAFSCRGLLLDFQRQGDSNVQALTDLLSQSLPCPVIVSAAYSKDLSCPVLLPPVPPSVPLQDWLSSWTGREIWLELALDGEIITLTEQGAAVTPLLYGDGNNGFSDSQLHCHYRIGQDTNSVTFTLWRTREDLDALISEAERAGVAEMIGLYQELAP